MLLGNVDEQHTLPFGTPDDVRKQVAERLETVGYDGGLIIGPTHHMQLDTPLEDFWAMVDAITGKRELTQGLFTGLGRQRSGGEAKIRAPIEVATLRAQSTMRSGVNL